MKLLLIDDHPLFALGFAHALSQAGSDMEVLTASTLDQGLAIAAAQGDVDVALIDYRLSDSDGISGLKRFGQSFPLVACVLISGDEDPALVRRARDAGASGFIGKSLSIDGVREVLQSISRGEVSFNLTPRVTGAPGPMPTARQLEVLALIAQGYPNKRIGTALGISDRTVKLHVTALLEGLSARNRTHLLVKARERGLVA